MSVPVPVPVRHHIFGALTRRARVQVFAFIRGQKLPSRMHDQDPRVPPLDAATWVPPSLPSHITLPSLPRPSASPSHNTSLSLPRLSPPSACSLRHGMFEKGCRG